MHKGAHRAGCRARNPRTPVRGGQGGGGRAGAALPRHSARDAAATTGGHRYGRACPSRLPSRVRAETAALTVVDTPEPSRPRWSAAGRAALCSPGAALLLTRRGGLESQRAGVYAIPVPGLRRSVVEDVAEVTAAATADNLGAAHEQAVVRAQFDRLGDRRLGEARLPRARIELGVRAEQLAAAAGAR